MSKRRKPILVIEDDKTLCRLVSKQLQSMGYAVAHAHTWADAKATLDGTDPSLALLDIRLPDADGLKCLAELSAQCPVIVLTAFGSIKHAVEAMRAGAAEYLAKPVNPAELELAVTRTLSADSLRRQYEYCRNQLSPAIAEDMVGSSKAFRDLVRMIELVAPSDATVLIEGESGVGKELVARSIHQMSSRATATFVPVDCCTLQESLFESELFGHERGSFTGADKRKQGLIEVAEGGTIFLDEIGELPASLQAKLLRLLETGEFRRLGGTQNLSSDSRFVAATNRDLRAFSDAGRFRRDLFYRLATVVIRVPSLRERREDIPMLAARFMETRTFQRGARKHLTDAAMDALTAYEWPGNIRELRNVIERAILVSGESDTIEIGDLALPSIARASDTMNASVADCEVNFEKEPTLEEIKAKYLGYLIARHQGHRGRIANILGVSERNTYRMVKKFGLEEK
ncbi:MAG: sigma-54-dependent Fis family transcriptional regulator [Hyphomicrobiaceae bacterium]|nr:sigma-54-dependent Fis family transcriptional regulator [Hyphomicrobiaceae bacterium]MCC0009654.1 sigma-54-dependent Fis family transcriptional regulator [Hyphomicrobiaceae bacterium]